MEKYKELLEFIKGCDDFEVLKQQINKLLKQLESEVK